MSWVATLFRAISGLTGLGNATSRLVEAAKASEPPAPADPEPPRPLGSGAPDAMSYLEGRVDEQYRQQRKARLDESVERLHAQAAAEEPFDAEQPSDAEGKP